MNTRSGEKEHTGSQCPLRETRAFEEIIKSYEKRVYGMALRVTGNPEDACDLTQEIFLEAYRSLPKFRGESRFETWLYRIATNKSIDWWRKARRNRGGTVSLELVCEAFDGDYDRSDRFESPEPGPEDALIRKETAERLWRLVAGLPEVYRIPLILYHCQHLSYGEIAEILRLSIRTVETRLYRAKKMLKERMEKESRDDALIFAMREKECHIP